MDKVTPPPNPLPVNEDGESEKRICERCESNGIADVALSEYCASVEVDIRICGGFRDQIFHRSVTPDVPGLICERGCVHVDGDMLRSVVLGLFENTIEYLDGSDG